MGLHYRMTRSSNNKPSKNKSLAFVPLILSVAVICGVMIGMNFNPNYQNSYQIIDQVDAKSGVGQIGRVEEILRFVENSYVDTINNEKLLINAIDELLSDLDPFSSYIPPKELKEYNEQLDGVYKGIGIHYIIFDDTIFITKVVEGGDAMAKGLERGDAIIAIDEDTVSGKNLDLEKIRNLIKNKKTEHIDVEIHKPQLAQNEKVEIELKEIPIKTAGLTYQVESSILYSKIKRFSANTYKQFVQSLEVYLDNENSASLILDMRDNPGGYLPETIKILSQLIKEKQRILTYTVGTHRKRKDYKSSGRSFFNIDDIVVLVNENSASGSEIIAGALQDWDRAIIMGNGTYGKGLVQEIYELKNGGALRLTVARYMTPSGRSIQKPYRLQDSTINFEGDAEFYSKLYERPLEGGGGIQPDITIDQLEPKNGCNEERFEDLHAFMLKEFPIKNPYDSYNDFDENFNVSKEDWQRYLNFLSQNQTEQSFDNTCRESFGRQVKLSLSKIWFDEIAYIQTENKEDNVVEQAIEILQNKLTKTLLSEKN